MLGYKELLEAAGATVDAFEQFGDYQGTWWGKVNYSGQLGWVTGSYGSCSGCDAIQAEFGFTSHGDDYHDFIYGRKEGCSQCDEDAKRFAEYGKEYLDNIISQEDALKKASEHAEWDREADDVIAFIKSH